MMSTNHEHGKGELSSFSLLVGKKKVILWDADPSHQVVWILLKVDRIPFGIINIYASNDPHDWCMLWRWCTLSLPPAIWVMCRDFNMVEKDSNKIGGILIDGPLGKERHGIL